MRVYRPALAGMAHSASRMTSIACRISSVVPIETRR